MKQIDQKLDPSEHGNPKRYTQHNPPQKSDGELVILIHLIDPPEYNAIYTEYICIIVLCKERLSFRK